MEREAGLLRCAKLNCYAEFNRMVQAISRSAREPALGNCRMNYGSSAEYLFYTTLVSMLHQIVQNSSSSPARQRTELLQVYQWFCANKPLICAKTQASQQRPRLALSTKKVTELDRPHTAPVSSTASVNRLPRPYSHGFTSSYMMESLALDFGHQSANAIARQPQPCCVGGQEPMSMSAGEMAPQRAASAGLRPGHLVELAPVVAARMELQREMRTSQAKRGERFRTKVATAPPVTGRKPTVTADRPHTSLHTPSHQLALDQPLMATAVKVPEKPGHTQSRGPLFRVVELDVPPHTLPTSRRSRPAAMKKKLASGFNCSRSGRAS